MNSEMMSRAAEAGPKVDSRPASTLQTLTELLRRPGGASLTELMIVTGWDASWVRGAVFEALKKQQGVTVLSVRNATGFVYRIPTNGDVAVTSRRR